MSAITYTLAVAWKEIQIIFRDRGGLAMLLLLPVFLGLMMGAPNMMASQGTQPAILLDVALVNQDSGGFGREVAKAIGEIKELKVESLPSVAVAEERVAKGQTKAAIVIPADFTQKIDGHTPTAIDVIVDPGERESASIVTGIMNHVVAEVTVWGEVQYGIRKVLDEAGVLAGASELQRRAAEAQTLGVIMTTLNEMRRTPAIAVVTEDLAGVKVEGGMELFVAFLFAGLTVMFIFLTVTWSSSSLLTERETGTLRRLLASPLPRGAVIAGKMLAFMLLAGLQVVAMFAAARLAFNVPLGQSPLGLVILTVVVAFAATALGMLVAALARSANQAANLGLLLGFVLAAIGGCFAVFGKTPLVRAEGVMGFLAKLTPQGHAVEAYYSLMAEKATVVNVLPQMGIVLAFGAVFFLVAVWRFKFE